MDDVELAPDHAAPVEWGEMEEPRIPARLHALKDRDTFLVADSIGDVLGLADGLFRHGKDFEILPLSGLTHMVPDPVVMENLHSKITRFLQKHLGGPT